MKRQNHVGQPNSQVLYLARVSLDSFKAMNNPKKGYL